MTWKTLPKWKNWIYWNLFKGTKEKNLWIIRGTRYLNFFWLNREKITINFTANLRIYACRNWHFFKSHFFNFLKKYQHRENFEKTCFGNMQEGWNLRPNRFFSQMHKRFNVAIFEIQKGTLKKSTFFDFGGQIRPPITSKSNMFICQMNANSIL